MGSNSEKLELTDLVDVQILQKIQDDFAAAMDLSCTIMDLEANPITAPSHTRRLCQGLIRKTKEGDERCVRSDKKCEHKAARTREQAIHVCHAGLTDFAVPIEAGGKFIAYMFGGQVLPEKPDAQTYRQMAEKIARDFGLAPEACLQALNEIPILSMDRIEAAANLMHTVANTISDMANQALKARQQAEDWTSSLHELGLTITSDVKLPQVLEKMAHSARKVLDADVVTLYQYFQDRDEFVAPPVLAGELRHPEVMHKQVREDNVVARIVRAGESHYAPNVEDDEFVLGTQGITVLAQNGQPERLRFAFREGIKSSAGVLLKVATEAVGVLFVSYREPRQFPENEKRRIETFANLAAIAIWNARLFDRRVEELEALAEIDDAITTSDLDTVLCKILKTAIQLIGANMGSLLLADESGEYLVPRAIEGRPWKPGSPEKFKIGEAGVTGWAAEHKQTACITDVHAEEWKGIYAEVRPETKSELAVPLLGESQKLVGIINVESPKLGAFSDDDQRLLEALAKQAAIAIENQRRYEAEQRARRMIEVLRDIDRAIISGRGLEEVLSLILDEGLELIGAPSGNIMLYDNITGDLWMAAGRGIIPGQEKARQKVGHGIVGLVAKERRPLRVSDVSEEPWKNIYIQYIDKIRAELAVPMLHDGIMGVFNAESPLRGDFSEGDERLLEALAGQAVIAIRDAKAHERFRLLYRAAQEIMQAELNERSILGAALRIGRERTGALSASARLLDESGKWLEAIERLGEAYDGAWKPRAVGKGINGWVAEHKKTLLVDVDHLPEGIDVWDGHPGTRWKLVVPIVAGDEYFGNLGFDCGGGVWFEEDEVRLIEGLAAQAAAALQQLKHKRRAEEAERRQAAMDKLTTLQALRTNLLHGFRARSLVRFQVAARTLRRELNKGIDKLDKGIVYETIEDIEQATLEGYADLQRIVDLPTKNITEQAILIYINTSLQGAYNYTLNSKPTYVQADLVLAENLPPIKIDPLQLSLIFENLFLNAYDALRNWGGEHQVTVTTFKAPSDEGVSKIGAKFSNTGPPVPDDIARRLFKEPIGERMGLYTSAWVLALYGGRVFLAENDQGRVTFVVEFEMKGGQ